MSGIRLTDTGAWMDCPACGLDVMATHNGMTAHAPFCNGTLQRYMTILADRGMRPFQREPWTSPRTGRVDPRVLGQRPAMHWRVATDEWYRLEAYVHERYGWADLQAVDTSTLFGWPIEPGADLAAGSIPLLLQDTAREYSGPPCLHGGAWLGSQQRRGSFTRRAIAS